MRTYYIMLICILAGSCNYLPRMEDAWSIELWVSLFLGLFLGFCLLLNTSLKKQKRKLQEKVKEQAKELGERNILYNLSSDLIKRIELEKMLQNLVDAAVELIPNAQTSSLFLLNEEKTVLEGMVSHMLPRDQVKKLKFKLGEAIGGQAIKQGKSIIQNQLDNDKVIEQKIGIARPLRSIIVVVLKDIEEIIGTISVENHDINNAFSDKDLTMLESLAANASVAIERVRLIDEIQLANENLTTSYNQLKELNEYKESMTGMIVHDFKNSLNTVINFSKGTPTQHRMNSIHQAGRFMLNMVMNILDTQKFEETSPKLSTGNYSISKVIKAAVEQLAYLLEQKSIKLEVKQSFECQVNMDRDLILRTMVNILSNAIKYSPQNGHISIHVEPQEDTVSISFKDQGPGIPADKLHAVFDKYAQLEAKKSGVAQSTGIGLTFCKVVVEAHGGTIEVESIEGQGSNFYFTLPVLKVDKESKPQQHIAIQENQAIQLSDQDKATMKTYLKELQQWEVYDYSEVKAVIEQIQSDSTNIEDWKASIMKAVQNGNEELFNSLTNM